MLTIGRYRVLSVINGYVRLDGGAMFGVVPKVLWEQKAAPDERNRIVLAMRTLVAIDEGAGRVILVDTGAGHKWPAKEAGRFALEVQPTALAEALAGCGLTEGDVTDVVITHLHFDHNGGLTEWADEPGGATRLRFERARHWIHERHWHHANHPNARDRASFLARDLEALSKPGVLSLVTGDDPAPPFEGVRWLVSRGHTPYQLLPIIEGDDGDLLFVGDMIPMAHHLPVPWLMAYDLDPLRAMEEKKRVHRLCAETGLRLAFPHDPTRAGVCVELADGKPVISRVLDF